MSSKHTIASPIPGVFYRKPSPEQPEFVLIGQEVQSGEIIGLIEIMKTYYEVTADIDGIVENIVENEALVDAGQELAVLNRK